MEDILAGLRAAAELTRLRILGLCAHADLTVSDLCRILGQSQPRVSRHLKILVEAKLLDRTREGNWVYYRLAERGDGGKLAQTIVDLIPDQDGELSVDLGRLDTVREERAERADQYFRSIADWEHLRSLFAPSEKIEAAIVGFLPSPRVADLLDIGTGTGRILKAVAGHADRVMGVDSSTAMLTVARSAVEKLGLRHVVLKPADMYALPFPIDSFDAVTIHMVLHYADDPAGVLREGARVLKPGGRLIVVDFAPHEAEFLTTDHGHRHLGFDDTTMRGWLAQAGLEALEPIILPGEPLTVHVWAARRAAGADLVPASRAGAA